MKYGYPEPPWTYSPKEINEWINAVYGGHKCKEARMKKEEKWLKNVKVIIDLNVEKEIKKPPNFILRIIGIEKIEEHFELLPTVEIILRALTKVGYKETKIKLKNKIIEGKIRKLIEELARNLDGEKVEIISYNDGKATIKISKLHSRKHHSIEMNFNKIKEKRFQKFLIYIRKRLHGKEEIK